MVEREAGVVGGAGLGEGITGLVERAAVGQLVRTTGDNGTQPLPIDPARIRRFGLSPDGARLAAVIDGLQDQELWVFDLQTGASDAWLRAGYISEPVWTPAGDQVLVTFSDAQAEAWSMVRGDPSAASPPETLMTGAGFPPVLNTYHADSLVIGA